MLTGEYIIALAGALGGIGVIATCLGALWQRDIATPARELDETSS
jgi:hypothetical protein